MNSRERLVAEAVLRQRGPRGIQWAELSDEMREAYLAEARGRIKAQDERVTQVQATTPSAAPEDRARALREFQDGHVVRMAPEEDWTAMMRGFNAGYDAGRRDGFKAGWAAAGEALAATVAGVPDEALDRPLIARIDVAVAARHLYRQTQSTLSWDELTEAERDGYMLTAEEKLRADRDAR